MVRGAGWYAHDGPDEHPRRPHVRAADGPLDDRPVRPGRLGTDRARRLDGQGPARPSRRLRGPVRGRAGGVRRRAGRERPDGSRSADVQRRPGRDPQGLADRPGDGEFLDAHERVMRHAKAIAPEAWREVGTIPWYGPEYALDDLVVYQMYGHKREHDPQLSAVLEGGRSRLDRALGGHVRHRSHRPSIARRGSRAMTSVGRGGRQVEPDRRRLGQHRVVVAGRSRRCAGSRSGRARSASSAVGIADLPARARSRDRGRP